MEFRLLLKMSMQLAWSMFGNQSEKIREELCLMFIERGKSGRERKKSQTAINSVLRNVAGC